jgi:hypothetical protein
MLYRDLDFDKKAVNFLVKKETPTQTHLKRVFCVETRLMKKKTLLNIFFINYYAYIIYIGSKQVEIVQIDKENNFVNNFEKSVKTRFFLQKTRLKHINAFQTRLSRRFFFYQGLLL